jgi:hypothetical protein
MGMAEPGRCPASPITDRLGSRFSQPGDFRLLRARWAPGPGRARPGQRPDASAWRPSRPPPIRCEEYTILRRPTPSSPSARTMTRHHSTVAGQCADRLTRICKPAGQRTVPDLHRRASHKSGHRRVPRTPRFCPRAAHPIRARPGSAQVNGSSGWASAAAAVPSPLGPWRFPCVTPCRRRRVRR